MVKVLYLNENDLNASSGSTHIDIITIDNFLITNRSIQESDVIYYIDNFDRTKVLKNRFPIPHNLIGN